jgi:septal ring factor EnvC (AmiA/AmiB activator)
MAAVEGEAGGARRGRRALLREGKAKKKRRRKRLVQRSLWPWRAHSDGARALQQRIELCREEKSSAEEKREEKRREKREERREGEGSRGFESQNPPFSHISQILSLWFPSSSCKYVMIKC